MKKSIICTAAFAFAFTCAVAGVSMAADPGPAEMTMGTKKPVHFPHAAHQKSQKCASCHHSQNADGTQGPYVEGQEKKCEECHNKDFANKKLDSFKDVGHKMCKSCHKKNKVSTSCKVCHPKK